MADPTLTGAAQALLDARFNEGRLTPEDAVRCVAQWLNEAPRFADMTGDECQHDLRLIADRLAALRAALAAAGPPDDCAETMLRRIGLLDRLVVESADEKNGDLIVTDGLGERWRLVEVEPGVWQHGPSGNRGNLGHQLRAIAWSCDAEVPARD